MEHDNSRNTIMFVICAVAILILYQFFVLQPAEHRRQAEAARAKAAATQTAPGALPGAAVSAPGQTFVSRGQAVAAAPRVAIDTPAVRGSVNLRGARLDDLFLKDYRQSIARDAPPVELFRPEGAQQAYFADIGWTGVASAPGATTVWTQVSGAQLTPTQPVVLRYDNGQGLVFTRTISVDQRYMFTVADTVANRGAAPVQLAPYASVQRQGLPSQLSNSGIIHEGAVGVLGERLKLIKFKPWLEKGGLSASSRGGWVGVTDKYWLAAAIPDQSHQVNGAFRVSNVGGVDVYEANFVGAARTLAPGMQTTETTRVFAGAKKASILQDYEKNLGVIQLDQAIDWGNFWFFTRPIFQVLSFYQKLVLNFGIAILLLTVTVKVFFFPLANKSYESISKMKKLQPQMEELKKKHEKDPQKQQQEIMALYQREKINPLMGCLPILVQIPVFYALYKVLSVTIEMRHAPFFGWIRDLSAPDPTSIWNLFGLIPYDPAAVPLIGGFLGGALHIGVWPLIMGFTMWLQQAMSPPPSADPTQKLVFQFLPIIFTFTMAHFAAGLVIYWSWNNFLSIVQQYVIMRRFKVENPIDDMLGRFRGKPAQAKG